MMVDCICFGVTTILLIIYVEFMKLRSSTPHRLPLPRIQMTTWRCLSLTYLTFRMLYSWRVVHQPHWRLLGRTKDV
jgi:hypothetical protein